MNASASKKREKNHHSATVTFDKKFSELKEVILSGIQEGKEFSDKELLNLIKPVIKSAEAFLPISIFKNSLSTLESVVLYLTAHKNLRFFEAAKLLKRNQRTIWGAYNRAKKKKVNIIVEDSEIKIPLSLFSDRNKAPLYALVCYLKDNFSINYSQIARLLNLDPRTIWVVYHKKK